MLDPVAHDRQTALTQREKCAARARRPSLGLRPRFVRLAPAHSHPDCRCCLTLIGARQAQSSRQTSCRLNRRMRISPSAFILTGTVVARKALRKSRTASQLRGLTPAATRCFGCHVFDAAACHSSAHSSLIVPGGARQSAATNPRSTAQPRAAPASPLSKSVRRPASNPHVPHMRFPCALPPPNFPISVRFPCTLRISSVWYW